MADTGEGRSIREIVDGGREKNVRHLERVIYVLNGMRDSGRCLCGARAGHIGWLNCLTREEEVSRG